MLSTSKIDSDSDNNKKNSSKLDQTSNTGTTMIIDNGKRDTANDKPISILRNGKNKTRTIKIRAPSNLEAGHVFTVNVEGEEITAAVVSIC